MARITVEDCLDKVDNRFELVMIASKRARQLQIEGKDPMLSVDNDKPTVLALREIADGLVDDQILIEKQSVELEDSFAGSDDTTTVDDETAAEVETAETSAAAAEETAEADAADSAETENAEDTEQKPAAEE